MSGAISVTAMAAIATTAVSVATGALGYMQQAKAQKASARAQKRAAEQQRKSEGERLAQQAQQQDEAERKQIREERIRRAEIMQAAENTGGGESSGQFGGVGSLSTQLSNNLGFMAGQEASIGRQSNYNTSAGVSMTQANQYNADANMWGGVAGLGMKGLSLGLDMGGGTAMKNLFGGGGTFSIGSTDSSIGFNSNRGLGLQLGSSNQLASGLGVGL